MSYQYDRYLAQHKSNVEAGFRWLPKRSPMSMAPMIFIFMEAIALME